MRQFHLMLHDPEHADCKYIAQVDYEPDGAIVTLDGLSANETNCDEVPNEVLRRIAHALVEFKGEEAFA